MNKLGTALGCLLLLGAALAPGAFAHQDSGAHNSALALPEVTTGLDVTDPEAGGDDGVTYYGDNDAGSGTPRPNAGLKPAGWYYGSISAWLELQAGPDLTTIPAPDPVGPVGVNPGFIFAAAQALCDMEILSDGSATGAAEDESTVDGSTGGGAPDGTFNDGGIGAVCHTPSTFYSEPTFNTDGCAYTNAVAIDVVSGEDIWISTSCDYLTPAVEAGLLDHVLTLSTCVPNTVFDGSAPGATVDCVTEFIACAITGTGCPSPDANFCGADGVSDAGESGQGDGRHVAASGGTANGVPYPAGPFTDASGNVCATNLSAGVFTWNSVIVDVAADANDPDVESLSVATHGWVA